jgi:hypothetical protein
MMYLMDAYDTTKGRQVMAVVNESGPSLAPAANGNADVQHLEAVVRELQEECRRLREALGKADREREAYKQLFLEEARNSREFENLDIPTLEAMSAGPVEMLEISEDR